MNESLITLKCSYYKRIMLNVLKINYNCRYIQKRNKTQLLYMFFVNSRTFPIYFMSVIMLVIMLVIIMLVLTLMVYLDNIAEILNFKHTILVLKLKLLSL